MTKVQQASKQKFIVFEGGDGAGTSTQVELCAQALRDMGQQVLALGQPSAGVIGKHLRTRLRSGSVFESHKAFDWYLAMLFAADRLEQYEETMRPALQAGLWVICDRYVLSSLVYQGRDIGEGAVQELNRYAPAPDLLFFIDVPPEVSLERISGRGRPQDIFETQEQVVQQITRYRSLVAQLSPESYVHLDGTRSIEDLHAQVMHAVEQHDA